MVRRNEEDVVREFILNHDVAWNELVGTADRPAKGLLERVELRCFDDRQVCLHREQSRSFAIGAP